VRWTKDPKRRLLLSRGSRVILGKFECHVFAARFNTSRLQQALRKGESMGITSEGKALRLPCNCRTQHEGDLLGRAGIPVPKTANLGDQDCFQAHQRGFCFFHAEQVRHGGPRTERILVNLQRDAARRLSFAAKWETVRGICWLTPAGEAFCLLRAKWKKSPPVRFSQQKKRTGGVDGGGAPRKSRHGWGKGPALLVNGAVCNGGYEY